MEKIAEEGFEATFSLKSGRFRALEFTDSEADEWGDWMQDIIQIYGDKASQIIWDAIKVNIFDSELTIYTKEGNPISLPQGANLIDFAFAVSEDMGLHCITGKVNGVLHDLNHKLNTGDQVDIIKSPNAVPKLEWENEVVSHRAVSKLHTYFKNLRKIEVEPKAEAANFDAKLIIRGEDRARMLYEITDAIGKSNIKRIYLDTSGSNFEGAISVNIKSNDELNRIFMKLLSIKGVRSVIKREDEK
jgi:(p)ppGpp synthase/HD superfamily hydrolase